MLRLAAELCSFNTYAFIAAREARCKARRNCDAAPKRWSPASDFASPYAHRPRRPNCGKVTVNGRAQAESTRWRDGEFCRFCKAFRNYPLASTSRHRRQSGTRGRNCLCACDRCFASLDPVFRIYAIADPRKTAEYGAIGECGGGRFCGCRQSVSQHGRGLRAGGRRIGRRRRL